MTRGQPTFSGSFNQGAGIACGCVFMFFFLFIFLPIILPAGCAMVANDMPSDADKQVTFDTPVVPREAFDRVKQTPRTTPAPVPPTTPRAPVPIPAPTPSPQSPPSPPPSTTLELQPTPTPIPTPQSTAPTLTLRGRSGDVALCKLTTPTTTENLTLRTGDTVANYTVTNIATNPNTITLEKPNAAPITIPRNLPTPLP